MAMRLTSGVWAGHYVQGGQRYPQEMTLEFADGLVRGDGIDGLGTFTLEGEYRVAANEVRLGWIKTYSGAHSVLYVGTLETDGIAGAWELAGARGTFLLAPRRTGAEWEIPPR